MQTKHHIKKLEKLEYIDLGTREYLKGKISHSKKRPFCSCFAPEWPTLGTNYDFGPKLYIQQLY